MVFLYSFFKYRNQPLKKVEPNLYNFYKSTLKKVEQNFGSTFLKGGFIKRIE